MLPAVQIAEFVLLRAELVAQTGRPGRLECTMTRWRDLQPQVLARPRRWIEFQEDNSTHRKQADYLGELADKTGPLQGLLEVWA